MNDKFFNLPIDKQKRILDAAYKEFSENSYKKAPMSEIAECKFRDNGSRNSLTPEQ